MYGKRVLGRYVLNAVLGISRDAYLGWDKTLGKELEVCETDGNPYTMYVGANVQALVNQVSARLRAAERRWQKQGRQSRQTA
jgi:hypothetical protein